MITYSDHVDSVHQPVTNPKLKYMNQIFGDHMLMMKPTVAITEPAIVTLRQPNLLVKTLAIGPENVF